MEDQSGIFTFLGGMLVLVLVGAGISIVAEKRDAAYVENTRVQELIILDRAELEGLSRKLSVATERFQKESPGLEAYARSKQKARREAGQASERIAFLIRERARLRAEISGKSDELARIQASYRAKAWTAAIGERFESIETKGGRKYQKVSILRVTPTGLEIAHSSGRARIPYEDLDTEWEQRFQWLPATTVSLN